MIENINTRQLANRKHWFFILGVIIFTLALVYSVYFLITAKHIKTDNAYVAADIAQITPSTSGTVKEVRITDTSQVKKRGYLSYY